MSGIETLGVLASATQLAAYSIKIVLHLDEIYSALQNTSSRTKGQLKQVKELIQTTTLIERHESLWSPAVHRQLQATLSEARTLHDLLQELANKYTRSPVWKYWSILNGVAEKEILISLDRLEREKSTLRLCIGAVHTDLLLNIQGSIKTFSSDVRMSQQPTPPCGRSSPVSPIFAISRFQTHRPLEHQHFWASLQRWNRVANLRNNSAPQAKLLVLKHHISLHDI